MKTHPVPIMFSGAALMFAATIGAPPPTKIEPVTETLHGVTVTDLYRWLEDQDSLATRAWIEVQNNYTRGYLDAIPGREQIRAGLAALIKIDAMTTPIACGGRYFFGRRTAREDRFSLYMRQGAGGKDEILIDPAMVSSDASTSVQYQAVSRDCRLMAYAIRRGGEDETEIRLFDVTARRPLPDALPRGRYMGFDIMPNNSGFYYARFTNGQGSRVYYHALGTEGVDRELFGSGYGPNHRIGERLSEDGRWLLVAVFDGVPVVRTELYVKDLQAGGTFRTIVKDNAQFDPEFAGNTLLLNTNWKALNRHILRVDLEHPAQDQWKEIVPEAPQAIETMSAAAGRVFVAYLDNVSTHIKQFDIDGKSLGDVRLPGIGSSGAPKGRWSGGEAFLSFTSFVEPSATYRYQVSTGAMDLWFRPKVPLRPDDFEVKQVWYSSKDGTKVPMFLVYRKGLRPNGNTPALMTAYGGFNISQTPAFMPRAAVWVQNGGVFALPNLRGGGEFGENWHHAGMFEKKQNVFDDFIAAAEWLIKNHYTSQAKLAIMGGSNGGLLMGAMMTQRPDLFGAIDCESPLLDMLRFHKLLVGSWWAAEYGSADDPKQFKYLYKYSPYHNVRSGVKYPPVLFATGDGDTRVAPAHARKMTALMQAATASGNPIILRYDAKGGHSAVGSVSKRIDEETDSISFLADRIGLRVRE